MVFDLVVTDDAWEARAKASAATEFLLKDGKRQGDVFVTVSLGVPFNGYHYKLVAAIITEREIEEALVGSYVASEG